MHCFGSWEVVNSLVIADCITGATGVIMDSEHVFFLV